jgi:hypothetical protein
MDVEECDSSPGMVATKNGGWSRQYFHGEGCEWHRAEDSAIARAEKMRLAKIKSLRKSIKKLESLSFAVGGEQ